MNHQAGNRMAVGALALALGLSFGVTNVWALTEEQAKTHSQAVAALKAATADLDSARQSAGTADNPAKGSRLRLTQSRLESGVKRLDQAAAALKQLPAEDDAVKPTLQTYNQALQTVKDIQAILQPPAKQDASDAPQDDKAGQADKKADKKQEGDKHADSDKKNAPASPKLHPQQEDALRGARFNLREVAGGIAKAQATLKQLDEPGKAVVHSQIVTALQQVTTAQAKLQQAQDALAKLPADHDQVAPVAAQAKDAAATLGALRSRLETQEKTQGKQADVANYPAYAQDFALLQEFARRYSGQVTQLSQEQPEVLAQIIREDGVALRDVQRIARTYLPLVEQKTDAGQRLENVFNHYQANRTQFAQQVVEYKKTLPELFEKDLQGALTLAQQAVDSQKPAFFRPEGAIEQQLGFARQKLAVIEAFGVETAKPFQQKFAAVSQEIKAKGQSLEQAIIAANTLPADNYQGNDRDALVALAKQGWSAQQKDAKVLKAAIPASDWRRQTRWEWHRDAFYKVDRSRLQVQLVIQHTDGLAVIRPVNLIKDHLSGDAITATPLHSADDKPEPSSLLPIAKVK